MRAPALLLPFLLLTSPQLQDGCSDLSADYDGDGYTPLEGDCDDTEFNANPGLPEYCDDAFDNNCDGQIDETLCEPSFGTWRGRLAGLHDGDDVGLAVLGVGDQDQDGLADVAIGAPGVDDTGEDAGAAYVFLGPSLGAYDMGDAAASIQGDAPGDRAGAALAGGVDLSGDGIPDLVVGAPGAGGSGGAFVFYGPVLGPRGLASADAVLLGEAAGDRAGASLSTAGDVNHDGFPDLLIGAPGAAPGGAAYLVYGPIRGARSLGEAAARIRASEPGAELGFSVAIAPDVDGDGLDDVLVGAPSGGVGGTALLFRGPLSGAVGPGDARAVMTTAHADAQTGYSVAGLGDTDGDGFGDVLIGAPNDSALALQAGRAVLIPGPLGGIVNLDRATAAVLGDPAYAFAGASVAAGGDLNGDGLADLLVGFRLKSWPNDYGIGAGVLNFGPYEVQDSNAHGDAAFGPDKATQTPTYLVEECGIVAPAGDVDGDGIPDVILGATLSSVPVAVAGGAFIFPGSVILP